MCAIWCELFATQQPCVHRRCSQQIITSRAQTHTQFFTSRTLLKVATIRSLCASCLARAATVASLSASTATSGARLVGVKGRLFGVAGRLGGVELKPRRQQSPFTSEKGVRWGVEGGGERQETVSLTSLGTQFFLCGDRTLGIRVLFRFLYSTQAKGL